MKPRDLNDENTIIALNNIVECRFMTSQYFDDPNENLLKAFLGDDDRLDQTTIITRNELFNYLKTRFDYLYNYWVEIRPNTDNQVNKIHIIAADKRQDQWMDFNNIVLTETPGYRTYKFPALGFSVNIYD